MAISNEEVQELKAMLEDRYNIDIDEKITRVEFISQTGEKVYFHTDDKFVKENPSEESILNIFEDKEIRVLPFKSMDSLIKSFASFQRLNQYKLSAVVNGKIIQEYTPIKEYLWKSIGQHVNFVDKF